MPLIDDLAARPEPTELDRRRLLSLLGSGALALAGLGTAITSVRYLWPQVLFEESKRFKVGRPEEIPLGQVLVLLREQIYVIHTERGFAAVSAVCTHLGCMTRYEPDAGGFFCPCHGSRYDGEGNVTAGPAPKKLPRFEIVVERGALVVDASKPVDPDAFLEV